jgi:hypothetical protein
MRNLLIERGWLLLLQATETGSVDGLTADGDRGRSLRSLAAARVSEIF